MADLSRLRKVLDYCPSDSMKGWNEEDYYQALNRRLNREIAVERLSVRPARDEAVLVVPPDQWKAAQEAQERQHLQELELEQLRQELETVQARRSELQREVDDLNQKLGKMRSSTGKPKATLQVVGVRKPPSSPSRTSDPVPASSPPRPKARLQVVGRKRAPTALPSSVSSQASDGSSLFPEAPLDSSEEGWRVLPPESPEPASSEAAFADDQIARVENEIAKIEKELATLTRREHELDSATPTGPFQTNGYTLYRRRLKGTRGKEDFYFFSQTPPESGEPSALPSGYELARQKKTGVPFLKKVARRSSRTKKSRVKKSRSKKST